MSFKDFYKNHVLSGFLDLIILGYRFVEGFVEGFKKGCKGFTETTNAIEENPEED